MANEERYTGDSTQTSYYHESYLKNLRLAECWQLANLYKRKGNLSKWKEELDIAFDELSSDAKIILTNANYDKYIKEMLSKINKSISLNQREKNKPKLAYWLRVKERVLRHIQNLTGRGTKIIEKKDKGKAIYLE